MNFLHDLGQSMLMASETGSIWSYLIIFIFSLLDTIFIIGTLFPGGLFVIAVGFLASYNILNIWVSLLLVFLGALTGDVITYYIGGHSSKWFKHDSRLFKLSYIDRGQRFFYKYGDKSIILGRFMGVIKAVVPYIAGLVKMDFKKFLYLNILSGFIWTVAYLGLGFFLGRSVDGMSLSREVKLGILILPFILLLIWTIFESRSKIFKAIINIFR
jgi:undecaprenyl-diphosphatase